MHTYIHTYIWFTKPPSLSLFLSFLLLLSISPLILSFLRFLFPLPLNPVRESGERCELHQRVWAEPGRQTILVHCKPNRMLCVAMRQAVCVSLWCIKICHSIVVRLTVILINQSVGLIVYSC